jgi:hypothetical protein
MLLIRFSLVPQDGPENSAFLEPSNPRAPWRQTIRASAFPARVSMAASGALAFPPSEQNQRYQLRIELVDQHEHWIAHYEQVVNAQSYSNGADTAVRVPFVQPLEGLVVPRDGTYMIRVVVDGSQLASFPVNARRIAAA